MQHLRPLIIVAALGTGALSNMGCRTINPKSPFHGTMSCSCGAAGCTCPHCRGEGVRCDCRGTDALGDRMAVGEPGGNDDDK